jgi:hypothetical protein
MLPYNESEYVKVTDKEPMNVGDIFWIKFRIIPGWLYIKAIGIENIERNLPKKYPQYEILARNYIDDDNYVWYKVKVVKPENEVYLAGAVIDFAKAIAVCGTIYLTLSMTKDMVKYIAAAKSPKVAEIILNEQSQAVGSQVQKAGIGVAIMLIAGAVLLYVIFKRR